MTGPVRLTDRVSDVLARDEALADVLIAVSPAFERLRRPGLRKVMTRLVTVEQAARVARVDADLLLSRLNQALAAAPGAAERPSLPRPEPESATMTRTDTPGSDPDDAGPAGRTAAHGARPGALAAIPGEDVVELDVRDALRAGEEPFSRIMAARRRVPEGGALKLRAIFEPAPLYAVLGKQGFRHWTEQLGEEDWVVWFYRTDGGDGADGTAKAEGDTAPAAATAGEGGIRATVSGEAVPGEAAPAAEDGWSRDAEADVVVLDVRGLEPPEPMVRTLAALDALPPAATLVQINVREPRFLLPQLAERGFSYEVRHQAEDLVRVFIRRKEGA